MSFDAKDVPAQTVVYMIVQDEVDSFSLVEFESEQVSSLSGFLIVLDISVIQRSLYTSQHRETIPRRRISDQAYLACRFNNWLA